MTTTNSFTTTLTSCNGDESLVLYVTTTPFHISLSSDLYSGTIIDTTQVWTISPGDTIYNATDFPTYPTKDFVFPILMFINSAKTIGQVTITTGGVVSFETQVVPLSGTAGFYPFVVTFPF